MLKSWTKNKIKSVVSNRATFRYFSKKGLFVFLFHDVSDVPSEFCRKNELSVTLKIFEKQIEFVKNNFNICSIDDFSEPEKLRAPAALITFDDGLESYFSNALPILKKYNCPSILFVNMEPVMGKPFYGGLLSYLAEKNNLFKKTYPHYFNLHPSIIERFLKENPITDLETKLIEYYGPFGSIEIMKMHEKNKLCFYGNHLFNHHNALTLSSDELSEAYRKNKAVLESFENHRNCFAYTFGSRSNETTNTIRENGVKHIFNSHSKINILDSLNANKSEINRISLPWTLSDPADLRFFILKRCFVI